MKVCFLCNGKKTYIFSDSNPGRTRVTQPMFGWEGPCAQCKGTGQLFMGYVAAGPGFVISEGKVPMPDAVHATFWAAALLVPDSSPFVAARKRWPDEASLKAKVTP